MRRSTVAYASPASEDNLGKDNVTGDGQNDNFGGWTEKFQEGILPVRKNSRRKKDSAAAQGKEKPAKKDDVGRGDRHAGFYRATGCKTYAKPTTLLCMAMGFTSVTSDALGHTAFVEPLTCRPKLAQVVIQCSSSCF